MVPPRADRRVRRTALRRAARSSALRDCRENCVLPRASGYSRGRNTQSIRPLVSYASRGTTLASPDTSKTGPRTTSSSSSSRSASRLPAMLARSIDKGSAFGFERKRSSSTEALPTRMSTGRSTDAGNRNGSSDAAGCSAGSRTTSTTRTSSRSTSNVRPSSARGFHRSSTRSTRSSNVSFCTVIPPSTSGPASRPSTVAIEMPGGNRAATRCQTNRNPLSEYRGPEQHAGRDEQRSEHDRAQGQRRPE